MEPVNMDQDANFFISKIVNPSFSFWCFGSSQF